MQRFVDVLEMTGMQLGVDIGGTFTDVALDTGSVLYTAKVLTTPQAPEEGVMAGIDAVLAKAAARYADLGLVIHGTTLATNALIERKGARTALITTDGFRDSVEMGTESRFEQYDIFMEKPAPLVPRHLRFTVAERMDAKGGVLVPLARTEVEALAPHLAEAGVTSLAIGFLHSYVNPEHERAARDIVRSCLPELPVSLSCEVSPEAREYERISTTCANAYVQPIMARYLAKLERALIDRGCRAPLFLMLSGGGVCGLETAIRFPIRLVESGPAGGAIFAAGIAAAHELDKVLSFDMGGTTAKICLIDDFQPQLGRSFEVARVYRFLKGSGLPLRIPVVEMVEIGAGGGSIAGVDALGRIQVGPQSAGSEPGPACYGRGGTAPTVTDADLLLGRIDGDKFAGGSIRLSGERAAKAVHSAFGATLDLPIEELALGIAEMVEENMAGAARVHAIESGKQLTDRTLIAFGGAAPLHAARLAEKLEMNRVIIPGHAGVGSAVGFLRAPVAYEIVRSLYQRVEALDVAAINAGLSAMQQEAERIVRQGAPTAPRTETRSVFMRYAGQGHEIAVPLPARPLRDGDAKLLRDGFEAAYRTLYHRIIPGAAIEILSWTVRVSAAAPAGSRRMPASAGGAAAVPIGERPIFDHRERRFIAARVYDREHLAAGCRIEGPAVIVEDETATLVTAVFDASLNPDGAIILERRASSAGVSP
jgi:N-methylhydantoinase A